MRNKLIFGFGALIALSACDSASKVAENTTQESVRPAKPMRKTTVDFTYVDKSVRPQDDFFMYSNGNWVKNNPVPASESRWGSFNELEKSNNEKLTKILESFVADPNSMEDISRLVGAYYQSFTDMDTRNKLGIKAISEELTWIEEMISKDDLPSVLAKLHARGIPGFFNFGVGQDLKNVDFHISYIGQGGLGLPNRDYYTKEDKKTLLEDYRKHINKMLVLSGFSSADAGTMANEIVKLESDMALQMMTPAEMRIPENTYNKKPKSDLNTDNGSFDWDSYFAELGSKSFDSLIISQTAYIGYFNNRLLNDLEFESMRSYLTWKVINNYAGHLGDDFVKANFDFYGTTMSGTSEMKPIKERAIKEITGSSLGDLLGLAFVQEHFSAEAQSQVNTMVDNLLIVFQERIQQLEWMSAETKKEALNKLNSIGRKLGFPGDLEKTLPVEMNAQSYIQNLRNLAEYDNKDNLSKLNEAVDKNEWGMPAHMVNAYYHPLLNEIAFPAGIMQPPFFSEHYEDAVNYGRIGMVIGHEFTHGFDDMGSKFAADGTFKNWWSEEDRKLFDERTEILGNTFSGFCPVDGQCVNPDLTMGENIADLGGLTLAYYAYTKTADFQSGELIENFTPAQRFFMAYAQLWKINYTEAELKKRLATDPHSPGMFRVNGPLMNCPEFFEAFNVQEGDPMRNSEKKVAKIW